MKEAELAARIIKWLERKGWDTYQEVECVGGVADIVAVDGELVWILETKTSLSFSLIDQARDRLGCANLVSVVCPSARRRSKTSYWVLRQFGIGYITADKYHLSYVCEPIKPKPVTDARSLAKAGALRERLEPEHKTYATAGGINGKRWTPFKSTCKKALEHVTSHGPVTVRQLIDGIEHHYDSDASARSTMASRIDIDLVPGLRLDRSCRPMQVTLTVAKNRQRTML